jgi:hypothetical protein
VRAWHWLISKQDSILRTWQLLLTALLVAPVSGAYDRACAQQPPNGSSDSVADTSSDPKPEVSEVGPELYLLDKDGKLVPVPGLTLEQFEELLEQHDAERPQRPGFTLSSLSIDGRAEGDRANVQVRCQVKLHTDRWVRVALRLPELVLQGPPAYEGTGEHFLAYEDEGPGGYLLWLRGDADSDHLLSLDGALPLATVADTTRLVFTMPQVTESHLRIVAPPAQQLVAGSGAALIDEPIPAADGTGTEFAAHKLEGPCELEWTAATESSPTRPAQLEAVGYLTARCDGQVIRTQAVLSVRSFDREFDVLHVRLPPDARLADGPTVGYTLELPPADAEPAAARLVTVRFDRPTTGPVELRLTVDQASPVQSDTQASVEVGSFEVLEAVRQRGFLAIRAAPDWQVHWEEPAAGAWRIDALPSELQATEVVAGFEYARQPFSIATRVVRREARVQVEPEYVVTVGAEEARLDARLHYDVRGAKVFSLALEARDWVIDSVGPENLVDAHGLLPESDGPLVIPLQRPTSGVMTIEVLGHRALAAGEQRVALDLPVPLSATTRPATLIVVPEPEVELRPLSEELINLSRQPVAWPARITVRPRTALFYRADALPARFTAERVQHAQRISVSLRSEVHLDAAGGSVIQRLRFHIAHRPAGALAVTAPARVAETGPVSFEVDGQAIVGRLEEPAGDGAPELLTWRIELPEPRVGEVVLSVQYPLAARSPAAETPEALALPLVVPHEGEVTENRLVVLLDGELDVTCGDAAWHAESDNDSLAPSAALHLTSPRATSGIALKVALRPRLSSQSASVDHVWLQSWFRHDGRRDRCVWRIRTRADWVEVVLPEQAASIQVTLDGRVANAQSLENDRVRVALTGAATSGPRVLEVRYHLAGAPAGTGPLELVPPRLADDTWIDRCRWQIVLPSGMHLVGHSEGFVSDHRWRWGPLWWRRQPLHDQRQLENWVGARHDEPLPAEWNQYLLVSTGQPPTLRIDVAGRGSILLVASLASLSLGLLLLYATWARRAAVLLLLFVALVALAVRFPEPAVLLAQSAVFGLGLALVAVALERRLAGRRRRITALPHSSSSIVDRRSTDRQARAPAPPPASTVTGQQDAPVAVAGPLP